MRVGVIGTGHVGLTTCVTLAALGHDVVGTDHDGEKIASLQAGTAPFFEPGLQDLLDDTLARGRLRFTTDDRDAVAGSEVVFICVGTPARARGDANLVAVENAARAVARHATGPVVVVEKSTVPAGTSARVRRTLERERPELSGRLHVASNPEFLREGNAIKDSLEPDRILVGAQSETAFEVMRRLYAPLTAKGHALIETDIDTAELAKHACNAFLALKISYANALARLCERAGADVTRVAEVMGTDPRIGRAFLDAGLGYGGYCFPKDIVAFERLAVRLGYDMPLLREVARINREAVDATAEKVEEALWNVEGKRVALFGLAFKPGTDDTRESPALVLARRLLSEGATVIGYDPQASSNAKADVPELEVAPDAYDAARGAHCVVVSTEWDEFRRLDLARLKDVMAYPVVVDGRNLFDPQVMVSAGFNYVPTGRPAGG
ncbi:MAG TPA: UDP-glucose/GDP-mannose dehydrogenase family protein [Actinomycetota bacterium]|nr:UDP-glucose/GDP-mannose dehydrogenase family protein [Actinomycetota bacterium]